MLAVCLSGMIAFAPSPQVSTGGIVPAASVATDSITIRHLEAGHYLLASDLPVVLEVRDLLVQADAITSPTIERAQLARQTLSGFYGARMAETGIHTYYAWVLIDGEIVRVCFTEVQFQVDFGAWGHVVVETEDSMRVP